MTFCNHLVLITLSLFLFSCSDEPTQKDFGLATKDGQVRYALGSSFELVVDNKKGFEVDSISFFRKNTRLDSPQITISGEKLGVKTFIAKVHIGEHQFLLNTNVEIVSDKKPKIQKYKLVNTYPHDINAYTQGLEFHKDTLYEGTGQRGESQLRKVDFKTGKILKKHDLDKMYFGEGITIMNDKIYQLTWMARTGFVYDLNTWEQLKTFSFKKSKQGWGLCNDGKKLYKSDGTEKIWTLDPETLEEQDFIQIYTNDGHIPRVNELEYINGKIFANIYQKNGIAIIDPNTGAVEAILNGSELKTKVTQHPELDVLNGIAYNPATNTVFLTGKNWDKIFEIELID